MTVPVLDEVGAGLQRALGASYEVRGLLGQGGFGVVYHAFDASLKRDVAIKVLRPEYHAFAESRERFRREAEAVARLRHPNVMPVYSVGDSEDIAWFVMPLVSGESLTTRLKRDGALPIAEVRRILREAAGAIAVAHRAGIIHRDIKPDNILLDGEERRVLLADFGIAKAVKPRPDQPGLTQTGAIIGSPQYMSPEQASGEGMIDHRTDVYSLGIVAYEMLTGELPFSGPTMASLLVQHLTEAAPPITRRRPDCPGDLATLVARCLKKVPDERWASASDVLQALDAAPDAVPRASGAMKGAGAAAPVVQFRRWLMGAGAGLAAAIAMDALLGAVLFTPVMVIIAVTVVAVQYGKLWTVGYSWADVAGRAGPGRSDSSPDTAEFGAYAEVLRQARSDRAAMVTVIERVPKASRGKLADVIPAADRLIARATDLARQHCDYERQIDPGPGELERRAAAVRAEPPSPGRNQRLATLERRRETVTRLMTGRDRLRSELEDALAELRRLHAELEKAVPRY